MAADEKSTQGSGLPDPAAKPAEDSAKSVAAPRLEGSAPEYKWGPADPKRERKRNLDTQSLKVLAPSNEVARSALEMRQNLEKFVPAGPQRDELIAQLKRDVTPILGPELDRRQALMGQTAAQIRQEKENSINEAIDRAAALIKEKLGQFETFGPVKEVVSISAAVVDHLRTVLHDPRRDKGEFQIAVGLKENKYFSSSRYFEPAPLETFAYERQTTEGLSDLQISGYAIEALIHAHQCGEGKDATHFSNADIEQADALQIIHPDLSVRSYLLTPAPQNIVIVYSPHFKEKLPLGETVGVFAENGYFEIRNERYLQAFQDTNLLGS